MIISILNNPVISIFPSPGVFVCENELVTLTASGGQTYLWEDADTGDSLGVGAVLQIKPPATRTFRVIGTDSNGCWEYNEIAIFVEQVDAFVNASADGVCEGDSVQLSGGSGDQLTWFENENIIGYGSNIYASPTQNTIYELQVENSSGCRDSALVEVEFYEQPIILNPIDDFSNCEKDTFSIAIQINKPIEGYTIAGTGDFENNVINGNLLTFDAIYNSDTSSYSITLFTDSLTCTIEESFNILPCPCIPPLASSIIIEEAKCNGKNGVATINIDSPQNFNYIWKPDLGIENEFGNSRSDLPIGAYSIEIIDTSNLSCSSTQSFLITSEFGIESSFSTTPADCLLGNGTANLAPPNYNYLWEDSIVSNNRTDLYSGVYFVTVTDPQNPDCPNIIEIIIGEENPLLTTHTIERYPSCNSNDGIVSIQASNGGMDYTYQWSDGFVSNDSIRTDLSAGYYQITVSGNSVPNCETEVQFTLKDSTNSAEINLIEIGDNDCFGAAKGSIDYTINYDTSFILEPNLFISDGTFLYENGELPAGDFCLFLMDGDGCYIDEVCFEIEEAEPLEMGFKINPDCGLGGAIDLEIEGGIPPYTIDWNDIPGSDNPKDRTGILAGIYYVTIYDSGGCSLVSQDIELPFCTQSCDFFGGVDSLSIDLDDCFINAEICFPLEIDDLQNCVILIDDELYLEQITSCDIDTFQNGYLLLLGRGDHEILIIDTLFDCYDLLHANVACSNSDNVCINEQKELCLSENDFDLQGDISTISNICLDSSFNKFDLEFDLDNLCIIYNGIETGNGSACIEVCDDLGNCEVFDLSITVENCLVSSTDFFKDTILVDETFEYCPDTSELPGNIVAINNFCPSQSGQFVDFFLDEMNFCVEYTGIDVGIDSACIEICDDLGFCDTTLMCVVVEENTIPPVAIDDCDTTSMGMPVVMNVLANDTLFGRLSGVDLVSDPMWGTAIVNLDNSITYNASDEFCERIDSFHYEVCNDAGCDTASVCVWIECVDIFVFTAVSANRDGINDVFYIAGIEDYPESILRIFNRWGNMVYEKKNYKNTWNGTYNNNVDLPDGTYFYLLELHDEENRVFKGYLELFR